MQIDLKQTFLTNKQENKTWEELLENKTGIVLFFYPKASTPGCSLEVAAYNNRLQEFDALNYKVIGISHDNMKANDKFACKYELNYPLICDEDYSIHKLFKVTKEKTSLTGKQKYSVKRSTFIIDKDGQVTYEARGVMPTAHIDKIIEFIKNN